jgi:hypothetical protein
MPILPDVHLRGTRAQQPLAKDVSAASLYYVTNEAVTERSNGTAWETYGGGTFPDPLPPASGANLTNLNASALTTGLAQASRVSHVLQNTETGTVNNWVPTGMVAGGNAMILWGGASNLTVTGIAGGVQGQIITIKNRGGGTLLISFPFNSSGSAPGNRLINMVSSASTPIAIDGFVQFIYLSSAWYLLAHEQGGWITPPFNAADYNASAPMTWTVAAGHIVAAKYRLTGRTLEWGLDIRGATLGGSGSSFFHRAHFGGFSSAAGPLWTSAGVAVGSTAHNALCYMAGTLNFYRDATFGGNWSLGVMNIVSSGEVEVV